MDACCPLARIGLAVLPPSLAERLAAGDEGAAAEVEELARMIG